MELKEHNIVFLLGAGCSIDAGIPISNKMVTLLEDLLKKDKNWIKYQHLYYYLRSSIEYAEGIFGNFGNSFNIEKLLMVMNEIEKRDKNIIYPFIGSWHIRLTQVAGDDFQMIKAFKDAIKKQLFSWVSPNEITNRATYYRGFIGFQNELGYNIKVFSLNYDLCFEKIIGLDNIEQGFSPHNSEWEENNFSLGSKLFNLYKLHGSINWFRDGGKLKISDNTITEDPELIFGVDTKLDSKDPFFFYTTEFRKWILDNDCKIIVTIGYSFADLYINRLISQAICKNKVKQLVIIDYLDRNSFKNNEEFQKEENARKKDIVENKLDLIEDYNNHTHSQIHLETFGANDFLNNKISKDYFVKFLKDDEDSPFKD